MCSCTCEENCCRSGTGWIAGFGEFIYQGSQRQTPAFDIGTGGLMIGYDLPVFREFVVGAALGYANIEVHQEHQFGSQRLSDFVGSVYGSIAHNDFFLNLIVEGGYQKITGRRNIFFPGFEAKANSRTQSGQVTPHIDCGYNFNSCFGTLEPFVSFDWAYSTTDSFKEKDAYPFNMDQKLHNSSLLRSEAGIACFRLFDFDCNGILTLRGKLSYVSKAPFNVGKLTASIEGAGGSFTVNSLTSKLSLAAVGLEAVYVGPSGLILTLNYDGEYAGNFSTSTVFLKVGVPF